MHLAQVIISELEETLLKREHTMKYIDGLL